MTVDKKGNLFVSFFGGANVSEFNKKFDKQDSITS